MEALLDHDGPPKDREKLRKIMDNQWPSIFDVADLARFAPRREIALNDVSAFFGIAAGTARAGELSGQSTPGSWRGSSAAGTASSTTRDRRTELIMSRKIENFVALLTREETKIALQEVLEFMPEEDVIAVLNESLSDTIKSELSEQWSDIP